MFRRPDQIRHPLFVVSPLFNAVRWRSRWKLFDDFRTRIAQSGAVLYTAEVAFGDREFAITESENHFRWRTHDELWLKESILNLLVQRLPADWKYVAWVDADVRFLRDDWANETLHQLQHFGLLQPWSEAHDLSASHEIIQSFRSFMWCYRNPDKAPPLSRKPESYYYTQANGERGKSRTAHWHPGYAVACRREVFEAAGGLVDHCVLGSADRFMADAAIGRLKPFPAFVGTREREKLLRWQERLQEVLRGNVGYVDGAIAHDWHGPKAARKYNERGQILIDCKFDPDADLVRDSQGLWKLRGNKPELRDRLREYFRQRNEDAC